MQKGTRKTSLVIAGLAILLLARCGLASIAFSHPQRTITIDSEQYLFLANSIRTTGRFEGTEYMEAVRTPGYPVLLVIIQTIFGESIGAIILIQLIFTALVAWFLYQCGKLLNFENVGLAAACIYAINPNALFWSLTVLTETFFSLLLLLSFYTLILALKRLQLRWFVLSGLLLGIATITRPIGLYLIPIWTLFVLLNLRKKPGLFPSVRFPVAFLVFALLPVLYWQTHNLILHDRFSLSNTTEITFTRFIAANTLAEALKIDRDEARLMILNAEDPVSYSFDVIFDHPVSFVVVTIRGIARTALGTEVGTWVGILLDQPYAGSGFLTALARGDFKGVLESIALRLQAQDGFVGLFLLAWGMLYSVVLYVLIGIGVVKVFRSTRTKVTSLRFELMLISISALYLILVPLSNGDSRFRVPAAPLLALMAGLAFLPKIRHTIKVDQPAEPSQDNPPD